MHLDDLLSDDDWEDREAIEQIKRRMPAGWHLIKVVNFNYRTLSEIDDWCRQYSTGDFKRVGWNSGCSYTVGVMFAEDCDAVYFSFRWGMA